jgi:hypothetical protein
MRHRQAATLGVVSLVLVGCSPAAPPTGPRGAPRPSAAAVAGAADPGDEATAIRRRLDRAADGLLYTSESDYPFEYFFHPAAVEGALTPETFRLALALPPDAAVEERSIDEFFARHIERADPNDPVAQALVPRYRHLKRTVERTVAGPRVFRVGAILIRCYVVGTDERGNVVGLTTFAVET